jgi:2-phosphoglycerate kinase
VHVSPPGESKAMRTFMYNDERAGHRKHFVQRWNARRRPTSRYSRLTRTGPE